jgi:hypothetical protein
VSDSPTDGTKDDQRLREGRLTLITAALALEGFTILLWAFASIVVIVLVIVVALAAR